MKARAKDTVRQDLSGSLAGDKVRIKTGSHAGERGILQVAADGALSVSLETGEIVPVLGEELTNFSLAARRAWEVMPKRAGRQPQPAHRRKWSVFGSTAKCGNCSVEQLIWALFRVVSMP